MASAALQFIDQSGAGISTPERRIIRSHVMRGKNGGRPRQSTRKQTTIVHIRRVLTTPGIPGLRCLRPRQLFWNDLCLTSFPQQLDSESTKLMHRWFFDVSDALFPPKFCTKFDIVKSVWVNCVLADEAYFHCTLAVSASYVDFSERKPGISPKSLYHISKAYALVNEKLSGLEPTSDSAIAAVITLAIYQQIHHQHSTGLIHLNGLYRMIQLRGGIEKLLKDNRALALKALRLDVELALQHGSLLFCRDAIFEEIASRAIKEQVLSSTPNLSHIMFDVGNFANLLNSMENEVETKLDPLYFMGTVISLLYRLLDVAPLGRPRSVPRELYDDVAHLATLAFMTTLLPEYGRDHPHSSYPLISDHLVSAIQCFCTDIQESGSSLLLWAMFISGISVLKCEDNQWLLLIISETCERLDLHDWPAVSRQICVFPWVHILHDVPSQCLWEYSQRRSTESLERFLQLED